MTLTATDILAITPAQAGKLFSGDEAAIKAAFRRLAQKWHPDHNVDPQAGAVLQHLTALRGTALAGGAAKPAPGNERVFTTKAGAKFRLRFLLRHRIEVGEVFVGKTLVAYLIDPVNADLVATATAYTPKFEDARMRQEMERFLPQFERHVTTTEGDLLIYKRTEDQILLRDLIEHCGGAVDPVHVAWFISGMANVTAYLNYAGLAHGGIGLETILVSPKYHSIALTGPFLYRTAFGERPAALPGRTVDLVPKLALAGVNADAGIDLELIRLTAREALGDAGGANLLHRKEVPHPVAMWLMTPPAGDGFKDYAAWERARDAGFGKRSFVEMTISPQAVYAAV